MNVIEPAHVYYISFYVEGNDEYDAIENPTGTQIGLYAEDTIDMYIGTPPT
jgi:hypothetical protein